MRTTIELKEEHRALLSDSIVVVINSGLKEVSLKILAPIDFVERVLSKEVVDVLSGRGYKIVGNWLVIPFLRTKSALVLEPSPSTYR